jgi:hypothetical protein
LDARHIRTAADQTHDLGSAEKADHAREFLPDPEDDNRTVLEKAKDAIAGA